MVSVKLASFDNLFSDLTLAFNSLNSLSGNVILKTGTSLSESSKSSDR